jgi:uncharacterized protein YaaQ
MNINRLIIAIVQVQDVDASMEALNKAGYRVVHAASSGGFLGSRNETLFIGFSAGQEAQVVAIMHETCRRRVEYVATPLEGAPFHLPLTTPVTVGGATVFTFQVERYEVIP